MLLQMLKGASNNNNGNKQQRKNSKKEREKKNTRYITQIYWIQIEAVRMDGGKGSKI